MTNMTTTKSRRKGAHRVRKAMLGAAALGTLTVGALGMGSSPAAADAYGCNGWRGAPTPWGTISINNYCAGISGSGTYVRTVSGNFTSNFGNVCNYNHTAEFFDSSGRWYMTKQSPVQYRCSWGTVFLPSIPVYQGVQRGFMCSTLKQNGARLTSVCHNIY